MASTHMQQCSALQGEGGGGGGVEGGREEGREGGEGVRIFQVELFLCLYVKP